MRTHQQIAGAQIFTNVVAVHVALDFVRQQNVDQVARGSRVSRRHWFETMAFGEVVVGSAGPLTDDHVAPAVAQVLSLSMSLAAVANDGNCLVFQQAQVCVVIVINFSCHRIDLVESTVLGIEE